MAVEGWIGAQGQGKSYCMVTRCVEAANSGSIVYSNLLIRGAQHFETWDDLMTVLEEVARQHVRATVAIDEAGKFLSSRFWQKADPRMLTLLQERRKIGAGVDLFFSVPSWRMIDTQLRDVAQRLHVCRRFGGSEYSHDGGKNPWFFTESAFWPEQLSTEHNRTRRASKSHRRRVLWFTPDVASLYSTGVVHMDRPMADAVMRRPDFRNVSGGRP
ncbi:MAG TPA: zonular occludens toxin domain-containing protein [Solirubrobacteraceae bacterium]|nr:zonular occludens toxin domain-containing protein [Solirubrobacteraceae bacterium]